VALAGYLHYVISVVDQICDALGIRCFIIKVHKEDKPAAVAAKKQ
jgi:hypothetical protein